MTVEEIPLDKIVIPQSLLRQSVDQEKLKELAASMQTLGLINPITVRKTKEGYVLIAGLRRYLAAKLLGWEKIRADVLDVDEFRALAITMHENMQREEITPIEYARFLKEAKEKYNLKLQELAQITGLSVPYISSLLATVELPDEVKELVSARRLDIRVAYELRKLPSPEKQVEVARAIAAVNMPRDLAISYINRKAQEYAQAQAREVIETHREVSEKIEQVMQQLPEPERKVVEQVLETCDVCGKKYPVSSIRRISMCQADYERLEVLRKIADQLGMTLPDLLQEVIKRITEE